MRCRLCLAINANMPRIGDMELKLFIEKIFKQYGINQNVEVHNYACWGCKTLLKKSYNFFQQVFKAQRELLNIMQKYKTENLELLNKIHRQESSLETSLSYKKTSVDYFIHKERKVEFIDDNMQYEKPSTSPTCEVFEQNKDIDSVENTEKVGIDEDECYIPPGVLKPSEHSGGTYYVVDPFNELARTTENRNVAEINDSIPVDLDPKKVKLLTDIEFTKMKKRRNIKSTGIDYKSLLPSSSDTENSGSDKKKIKKNKSHRKSEDSDFVPEKAPAATTSESSEDSFDDEGKPIKRPKDRRVYPLQCENCEAEIFEKRVHYHHYLIYHPDIEYPYLHEKKYLCQYCGKGYRGEFVRNQHEQIHSGKRAFQCPICPKKFLNSTQMFKHKFRVHSTLKFTCDYCGRNTKTREALIFHIRSHTGEKPYNCHICNAAFSHHAYRISHIKHAHGQNSIQTKILNPKAVEQRKTENEVTKRGRKKGNAKQDDSKKKEKSITKKRDTKKGETKKSDAMKETKEILDAKAVHTNKGSPTEKKNIKETTKRRSDSTSSEDEILAFISNRKGPRQGM